MLDMQLCTPHSSDWKHTQTNTDIGTDINRHRHRHVSLISVRYNVDGVQEIFNP